MEKNNPMENTNDISRFLEKYNQENTSADATVSPVSANAQPSISTTERQEKYNQSFEKLEKKVLELEEKFAASSARSEVVLQELVKTRQAMEKQQTKDVILSNITTTIEQLKQSIETLSRAQQVQSLSDMTPPATSANGEYVAMSYYKPDNYRASQQAKLNAAQAEIAQTKSELETERAAKEQLASSVLYLKAEQTEKDKLISSLTQQQQAQAQHLAHEKEENAEKVRIISALQQKASQLKAVNVALDREIKRAQQDRLEALRKSAEQAKEILSLRSALTAAEERFKSFDFEGRIISIKREYEQKVSTLENQLQEISATCMKQVEEIESLKSENIELHKIAEEREQLAVLYDAKTRELETLRAEATQLHAEAENPARMNALTQRMQHLQQEHTVLSEQLTKAQDILQAVTEEKDTLEKNFKNLLAKIDANDTAIKNLKEKIIVLTQENETLKKQQTPKAPQAPVLVRQPAEKPLKQAEAKAAQPLPPEDAPVSLQNTLHAAVKTSADLPEIRVAERGTPVDVELEDDFLEKTDSFIGRMRWSIFRDDK